VPKTVDVTICKELLWLLGKPKRIKIAVGGRGSGKTIGVSDIMLGFANQGERICCTREYQNVISDSVHETLKQEIDRLALTGFTTLDSRIRSAQGGEIFYKGLARNISSLQSLGAVQRLWIEEGQSTSTTSLKVLTPSIRSSADTNGDIPEIWITMNRFSRGDGVAKKYLSRAENDLSNQGYYEDALMMVVEMNYNDNPWFPP